MWTGGEEPENSPFQDVEDYVNSDTATVDGSSISVSLLEKIIAGYPEGGATSKEGVKRVKKLLKDRLVWILFLCLHAQKGWFEG